MFFFQQLNQDVLENFFSQIHQVGGVYDHPTPMSCIYRIQMIILGKSPTILRNQTNMKGNDGVKNDEYATSEEPRIMEIHEEQKEELISASILAEIDKIPDYSDEPVLDSDVEQVSGNISIWLYGQKISPKISRT